MSFLSDILDVKKEEVKKLKSKYSFSSFESEEFFNAPTVSLKQALSNSDSISLIAEIKKASPSKGILLENFDHIRIAETYIENNVNAISVLTDNNFFKGSVSYLFDIAKFKTLPLLRKDFIIDEYQILEAKAFGADSVLLICEALSQNQITDLTHCANEVGLEVLLELHSQSQLAKINFKHNSIIGINNRNLETFIVDINTTLSLIDNIPIDVTVVSESGISASTVIENLKNTRVDAVLVGEHFMKSADIKQSLSQFREWCAK